MRIQSLIETKLQTTFEPIYLDVQNESHMHSVPPGSESHFKVIIVSAQFSGRSLIEQQRLVNSALADVMNGTIHALTMKTLTPERWTELGQNAELVSPACHGGGKV